MAKVARMRWSGRIKHLLACFGRLNLHRSILESRGIVNSLQLSVKRGETFALNLFLRRNIDHNDANTDLTSHQSFC